MAGGEGSGGVWGVVCRFQCGWEQLVASWIRAYSYLRCRNAVIRHGWFDSMHAVSVLVRPARKAMDTDCTMGGCMQIVLSVRWLVSNQQSNLKTTRPLLSLCVCQSLSACLSLCLCLSVCPSVCLSVCLSPPPSPSPLSFLPCFQNVY